MPAARGPGGRTAGGGPAGDSPGGPAGCKNPATHRGRRVILGTLERTVSEELAAQRPTARRAGALAAALLAVLTLLFMVTGRHIGIPAANAPDTGDRAAATPGTHMITIDSLRFVDKL